MSELQTLRDVHETIGLLLDTDPAGLTPELRAELLLDLRKTILARGEKLDSIANVLLHLEENAAIKEASAAVYEAKAAKLRASASSFQRDAKRLGDYVLSVMAEMPKPKRGVRTLEGISSTFKAKSVADSVDVYDPVALPVELLDVCITVSAKDYDKAVDEYRARPNLAFKPLLWGAAAPAAVSKAEIKAALEKRVPCPDCWDAATGQVIVAERICPRCHGEKTVPATIPGARLVTGKLRLEVS